MCDSAGGGQQAALVSYDAKGAWGSFITATDPNTLRLGANGVDKLRISNTGLFATDNLDMGNKKITSLAAGTSSGDAVNKAQLDASMSSFVANANDKNASASAEGDGSIAIGSGARTVGGSGGVDRIAIGQNALAGNSGQTGAIAIGGDTISTGNRSLALGYSSTATGFASAAIGRYTFTTGSSAVALGNNATASADGSVALGSDSLATQAKTVSIGKSGSERRIVNVAAGTATTDAVNVSQLTGVVTALGGDAAVNADGSIKAPTYMVQGTSANNVGTALASLDTTIKKNTGDISNLTTTVNNITSGTTSLVQQDATSNAITVAKSTGGTTVDFTGTAGTRQLKGVSKGAVDTDAVNVSQLKGIATVLGGGAEVSADGSIKKPYYAVQYSISSDIGTALTNLDNAITKNTDDITTNTSNISKNASDINNLANGVTGLVQQDATSKAITVAKSTGGTTVDFTGTAGTRQLNGVSKGAVDTDAVNVSQLRGVTAALGGDAAVNADGSIKAPSYLVQGTSANNVGTALASIDAATTKNTGDINTNTTNISKNTGDITNLSTTVNNITSGTTGLVQQDATSNAITVAKSTDGTTVDFTGTAGTRQLNGVSKGAVDTDAVNVSQLRGVTAALGGDAAVNADGSIKAPSYVVQGTSANNVGTALASIDAAVTKNTGDITTNTNNISKNTGDINNNTTNISKNTGDITNLSTTVNNITSGTTGLVQQDATSKAITVAKSTGGTTVDFTGTAGTRQLNGVSKGAVDTDAVNVSQLRGVTAALGGDAAVNADGSIKAPSYIVQGTSANNVGTALASIDAAVTKNTGDITTNTNNISKNTGDINNNTTNINKNTGDITNLSTTVNNITSGTTGLVQQDATSNAITVAKSTGGTTVDFTGTAGTRQLNGVSKGAVDTDAVNVSQLRGVTAALGGDAAVNADGSIKAPSYVVQGASANNVGTALASIDAATTKNTGDINTNTTNINKNTSDISKHSGDITNLSTTVNNITSGTTGLVQQDATSNAITVAKSTGGTTVDFTGTAGTRQLNGVSKGAVDTDAVNVSQLRGVTAALGGDAAVNADGSIKAPSYVVQGTSANNVGTALASIDAAVTKNTGDITTNTTNISKNTGDITNLSTTVNNITSGTTGLVQQDATSEAITVAKSTGGTTVDFTGTAGTRQLNGVSKGAVDTDAVNVSQLRGVTAALGGDAEVNADGSIKAPSYIVQGTTANNVGSALSSIDAATTKNTGDIITNTTNINKNTSDISKHSGDITNLSTTVNNITSGTTGLVQQDATSNAITVAKSTGGTTVDFTGTAGTRQLNGVSKGAVDTDAVNVSQLRGVTAALGGDAAVNADGSIKAPSYLVQGASANNVGTALASIDAATTKNTGDINTNTTNISKNTGDITNLSTTVNNITSGTTGLVQQDATSNAITVAKSTGGTTVDFTGTAGTRQLNGVSKGAVDTDAVNVSQLMGVTAALGGDAAVNADGSIKAPSYVVQGTSANNVGTALASIDAATTKNTGDITTNTNNISKNTGDINNNTTNISKNTGDITNLSTTVNNITSGATGLVQQDATSNAITVAKSTGGTTVDFTGTAGTRQLNGVSKGAVDTDAVNVSQLRGVTAALGGDAAVNADGSIKAPSYIVQGTTANNVGSALSSLDTATTKNTGDINTNTTNINKNTSDISKHSGDITNLSTTVNNITSGTTGLVQQDATSNAITVAKSTGGTTVDFTGTAGTRQLNGVSKGVIDTDAVNVSQLKGVTTALGGGAEVSTDGSIKAPSYVVQGTTANNVGSALSSLDTATTKNTGDITTNTTNINKNTGDITNLSTTVNNITSGTTGLVQQDATSNAITVAKSTGGTTVDFTGTAGTRQLNGVSKGAVDTDAVNVSQLRGVTAALGGDAAVNADGSIKAPSYVVQGTSANNVGTALASIDAAVTKNTGDITTNTNNISKNTGDINNNTTNISKNTGDITNLSTTVNNIISGTTGLVQQDATSKAITVAKSTGGTTVDFTGTAGTRQLNGVSKGAVDTDAVNVSQLRGVTAALGGDAAVNADGSIKAPSYLVQGASANNVGTALASIDAATTKNTGDIITNTTNINKNTSDISKHSGDITNLSTTVNNITSGTTGLVQQDATSKAITVAKSTDGTTVDFTGTAGTRQLNGVSKGAVDTDAVNVSQLKGVTTALGGGAEVNADGSIKAPSYVVQGTTANNVGSALSSLDTATTKNTGDITNLSTTVNNITSGATGLVQQDATSNAITVAKSTGGTTVDFTGTAGTRQLNGVSKGTVDTDAVNVSQLKGVTTALGGGAEVNADGSIKAPSYVVQGTTANNVGSALSSLDAATTKNTGDITTLNTTVNNITNGTTGLVQQDPVTHNITIASTQGGELINVAGSAGPRVITGVANGVNDRDAVTVAQLKSVGLVDASGKMMGAVVYDDISLGHATLGGTHGTVIGNLSKGRVASDSMEAINGGQLFTLQEQINDKFNSLNGHVKDLNEKVTHGNDGAQGFTGAIGGQGIAGLNGLPGTSNPSTGSIAIGTGAQATGNGSLAIGNGAAAPADNAVALGQGSLADRDNTVSVGAAGAERQITNVAAGVAPTDAVNLGQLNSRFDSAQHAINSVARSAYSGVAAAMAMPSMTPSGPGRTIVAAGAANYKNGSAAAASVTYRSMNGRWLVNGAVSVTSTGDAGVRTQVGYEF
ncbi:YadA-like family protein [Paraburkholderia bonniea]|uniref:YadA-like family protein n=1 Tax=Paraburkholderia bonniea TaxID=2152891 RepID=UPI001FE5B4EF|nr:YadA-like family protein [Paraburkholderia bonniea]